MGVTVCLPLFGNPGHELEVEENDPPRSSDLRKLGDELRERLVQAADALDKLQLGGWSASVAMYDLLLTHPQVDSREKAEALLQASGLDPAKLLIVEDVEEELDEI